jgi:hypothetical protein
MMALLCAMTARNDKSARQHQHMIACINDTVCWGWMQAAHYAGEPLLVCTTLVCEQSEHPC